MRKDHGSWASETFAAAIAAAVDADTGLVGEDVPAPFGEEASSFSSDDFLPYVHTVAIRS